MKILYIISAINNQGGVARVLATKTNYFVENFGYEVIIVTENNGNEPLFFEFNPKIKIIDIKLSKNKITEIIQYKTKIQNIINEHNPNYIITSNFHFKSFLIPYLLKTKNPIIFEAHGSKFNEELFVGNSIYHTFRRKIKVLYRGFLANKFDFCIVLSPQSFEEWNIKNAVIIPNAIWFQVDKLATLQSKKVITVARHSYEKGLDRLLPIWKIITEKYPDWVLEIYGEENENQNLVLQSLELKIENNVVFLRPVSNIVSKYQSSSIYVMTSRFEAFPMVLLEAMMCGLPVVAYDCPTGPRAIVANNEDGFLIENGNEKEFVSKLLELIENQDLRIKIGAKAHQSVVKYDLKMVMNQWNTFFVKNNILS